ncbi:MAG TPA: cytochrome-c peroxidase [Chthonomonadaceae bacterium]|nr:cytochrome-c peroxidase [Chthonomonadaceae bacterium]
MKKSSLYLLCSGLLCGAIGLTLCLLPISGRPQTAASEAPDTPASHILEEPIQPIPLEIKLDSRKVTLGNALFHDKRLSHDDTIACASCHSLDKGGTDQKDHSVGIGGAIGGINAPSVLNSGLNFKQFWNGRAETLEDQVDGPTQHPKEMGSTWPEILDKLKKDPKIAADFAAIYPDGVQHEHVKEVIATFERSLITPNSRFDKFLRGDSQALTEEEKRGYLLFKSNGCAACHQGINVGGNMFAKFGVMADYFAARGNITEADWGRYNVTKQEQDRYVFRVPSLRNIALTAPYLHDGSAATLEDAIQAMARYQLGRFLSPDETGAIAKFLQTLTGELKVEKGGQQ